MRRTGLLFSFFGPRGTLRASSAGVARSALSLVLGCLLWGGCSSRFPVLIKVDPDVDMPKAVDIVWVITESTDAGKELTDFREKGVEGYFSSGRVKLSPGNFRFYQFVLKDQPPQPGSLPLEVSSEPGGSVRKLYGPYSDSVPSGAKRGYLFVEYRKDLKVLWGKEEREIKFPLQIYPKLDPLPPFPGYEDRSPKGISIEIGRSSCLAIPYEKEDEAVIQEAERTNQYQKKG